MNQSDPYVFFLKKVDVYLQQLPVFVLHKEGMVIVWPYDLSSFKDCAPSAQVI
jgi:hypothetical protein